MKKVVILMPTYNDWESVQKLLVEIDIVISKIKNFEFKCIIINVSLGSSVSLNTPEVFTEMTV